MEEIIIATITTASLIWAIKQTKVKRLLDNKKLIIAFLIAWTILGFFTQDDFTERCGCLVLSKKTFSIDYIIYSSISLTLFLFSLIARAKLFRNVFFILELFYWLFKLFILKNGYIGGLGVPIFKIYDFIGLFFRLWFISLVINLNRRTFTTPIISALLILLKLELNPCGENILYNSYIEPKLSKQMLKKLEGSWIGNIHYNSRDTIKTLTNVKLKFKDSSLFISNFNNIHNNQYFI